MECGRVHSPRARTGWSFVPIAVIYIVRRFLIIDSSGGGYLGRSGVVMLLSVATFADNGLGGKNCRLNRGSESRVVVGQVLALSSDDTMYKCHECFFIFRCCTTTDLMKNSKEIYGVR